MREKLVVGLVASLLSGLAWGSPVAVLEGYEKAGAGPFDAAAGRAAWFQEHRPHDAGDVRSCATCHGRDLTRAGRHATTGKAIEPMAVSANSARLSDADKVEKWFRRKCRRTLGRECTPQEKGDFIRYIISQ